MKRGMFDGPECINWQNVAAVQDKQLAEFQRRTDGLTQQCKSQRAQIITLQNLLHEAIDIMQELVDVVDNDSIDSFTTQPARKFIDSQHAQ